VQRPGKLRFEYAQPSPLEIIADGTSVAIKNRKLNTQDVYFISQTPLKFLLKGNLDLAKDVRVLGVAADQEQTSIRVEDKTTLGGASRITLIFNTSDFSLARWVVTDPQGNDTRVQLSNLDLRQRLEKSLFVISTERFDNP
jgi:outer membrane lipoprotein-sorting protein